MKSEMTARGAASLLLCVVALSQLCACSPDIPSLPTSSAADRVVVDKASRRLTLFSNGTELKSYKVALGRNPIGTKVQQGDNRTPEGSYTVEGRNPKSSYHRALRISYPSPQDRDRAKAAGVSPGSDIMIHGIRNGFGWLGGFHRTLDWTRGCIAVTDDEIEEIWRVVPDGTIVEIRS